MTRAVGLVVIDDKKKSIGRIDSKHIISNIIDIGYPECLELNALQIMDDFTGSLDKNSSLGKVLEIFDITKFAFVPITANNSSDKIGSTRRFESRRGRGGVSCINFHKGYSTYNSENEY